MSSLTSFRSTVWKYWRGNGRHDLPWRKTKDPYKILVSEVMLQQTQVSRVIDKYKEFLKTFPTIRALAKAPLSEVLKVWSGLGYNRRGKYLRDAAKQIVKAGSLKKALENPLLGVGPYTRAAVRVFAFNESDTLIETNIRAAFIHHFFPHTRKVHDRELYMYVEKAAKGQDPRTWYWALMDYGTHLKRSGVRNNNKSAHYTRQSKFEGSLRQVRGAILRELHKGSSLLQTLPFEKKRVEIALAGLVRDGLIVKVKGSAQGGSASGRKWRIA